MTKKGNWLRRMNDLFSLDKEEEADMDFLCDFQGDGM